MMISNVHMCSTGPNRHCTHMQCRPKRNCEVRWQIKIPRFAYVFGILMVIGLVNGFNIIKKYHSLVYSIVTLKYMILIKYYHVSISNIMYLNKYVI